MSIESTPPAGAAPIEMASNPALQIPAVVQCIEAQKAAFEINFKASKNKFTACRRAALAFRAALPPLDSRQNIAAFLTCVSYGLAIDAIGDKVASKLFAAARIALGLQLSLEKQAERNKKNALLPQSNENTLDTYETGTV
jgi:hypothetical protein